MIYHSALTKEIETNELTSFEINNSTVFQNDISKCYLPPIYETCDLIYMELAWKSGIKEFNKRSKAKVQFNEYAKAICKMIEEFQKPIFLITGFCDVSNYPIPDNVLKTTINGSECAILIYHFDADILYHDLFAMKVKNDSDFLLSFLSNFDRFQTIGDLNCGYGKVGLKFYNMGKNFVMSDYNKKCIYKVKELIENE